MKKFIHNNVAVSLLALMFLSGCSLLEADFNGEAEAWFTINESKEESNITYNDEMLLDAAEEDDIADNLDKIKDWTVEKVSYAVKNYQGDPAATFSGSMGFSKASGIAPTITVSVSGLNLNSLNDGPRQTLSLTANELATMASWLEDDPKIKVYIQGVLSQGPIFFDLVVYANVKVKASVL